MDSLDKIKTYAGQIFDFASKNKNTLFGIALIAILTLIYWLIIKKIRNMISGESSGPSRINFGNFKFKKAKPLNTLNSVGAIENVILLGQNHPQYVEAYCKVHNLDKIHDAQQIATLQRKIDENDFCVFPENAISIK